MSIDQNTPISRRHLVSGAAVAALAALVLGPQEVEAKRRRRPKPKVVTSVRLVLRGFGAATDSRSFAALGMPSGTQYVLINGFVRLGPATTLKIFDPAHPGTFSNFFVAADGPIQNVRFVQYCPSGVIAATGLWADINLPGGFSWDFNVGLTSVG